MHLQEASNKHSCVMQLCVEVPLDSKDMEPGVRCD